MVDTPNRPRAWFTTGSLLKPADSGPVFLIVEGFKLFADKEVVDFCDHLVWLEADVETCAARRAQRPENPMPAKTYRQHAWPAHMEWRQEMLRIANSHRSEVIMLDSGNNTTPSASTAAIVEELRKRGEK